MRPRSGKKDERSAPRLPTAEYSAALLGGERDWWGKFDLELGRQGAWRIGPMELYVDRRKHEWRLSYARHHDPADRSYLVEVPASRPVEIDDSFESHRYGVGDDRIEITFIPVLADRPVVARPAHPFHVPAGEEVTVFISTPLWVQIYAGGSRCLLRDMSLYQPSQTWFGPSPREGELCYASRTYLKLLLEELPPLPHRATTAVRIRNEAEEPLTIERTKLPVNELSVFRSVDGRFWTEDVFYVRAASDDFATFDRARGAPARSHGAPRVSGPRQAARDKFSFRAFSSLFSARAERWGL